MTAADGNAKAAIDGCGLEHRGSQGWLRLGQK